MIDKKNIKKLLESIKNILALNVKVNDDMVTIWHKMLRKHNPDIIKKAREAIVNDWKHRYFPMPKDFKDYLAAIYRDMEGKNDDYVPETDDLSENSARVSKLLRTSERNIENHNPDHKITCYSCNKKALTNLKADDYYEYWGIRVTDKLEGKYLCAFHTDELNKSLEKEKRYGYSG